MISQGRNVYLFVSFHPHVCTKVSKDSGRRGHVQKTLKEHMQPPLDDNALNCPSHGSPCVLTECLFSQADVIVKLFLKRDTIEKADSCSMLEFYH